MSPTVDCGNQLPTFRLNAWNARAIDAPTTREYSGNGGTPFGARLFRFRIWRPFLPVLRREKLRLLPKPGEEPRPRLPGDREQPPDRAAVSFARPHVRG